MGLRSSKHRRSEGDRRSSLFENANSNHHRRRRQSRDVVPQSQYYTPQHHHAPARHHFRPQTPQHELYAPAVDAFDQPLYSQMPWNNKYSRFTDDYETLEQVTAALNRAGLESSNLIVGIDFTKSNEWTGARSFHRKCLHHIGHVQNPYEQAISIIGKTLSAFDEDNLIPCYGFGDASTHDQDVFSLDPDHGYCNGFEEVLRRYRELVPHLQLSGPTSFAPIIEMAMTIVEQSNGQYHVLLIIADGQVTRSVVSNDGEMSPQEKQTIDAIVRASEYPLSIVLVGVGDGPWDMMQKFDDNIPARVFDNFQFVNFTKIMSKNVSPQRKEAEFALEALMEIPSQYRATIELNILGRQSGHDPQRIPRHPPHIGTSFHNRGSKSNHLRCLQHKIPHTTKPNVAPQTPASTSFDNDNQICIICFVKHKNMAFGCGHQTCCDCGKDLQSCPICRSIIKTRIKLFP